MRHQNVVAACIPGSRNIALIRLLDDSMAPGYCAGDVVLCADGGPGLGDQLLVWGDPSSPKAATFVKVKPVGDTGAGGDYCGFANSDYDGFQLSDAELQKNCPLNLQVIMHLGQELRA